MAFGLSEATRGTFARPGHGLLGSGRFVAVATRLWKGRFGPAHKPKEPPKMSFDIFGGSAWVSDGTRTRDSQDHNLVLYQLNYAHHCLGDRFDPVALT